MHVRGVDAWPRSTPLGSHLGRDKLHVHHLPSYLIPSHHSRRLQTTAASTNTQTALTQSSPFLCPNNNPVSLHRGDKILVNLGIIPLALARVAPTLPSSPRNLTKKTSMPPDEQIARE
ncbi:uncharacterized protein GLRG_02196 [Colletotrichum graminicola M1.001]|uniref:Uncharacterized protein n=1 Tax=Colletotrichum graminicola (strain M1.001 / M2 / FGSC 10212) TaxID=645133 RepID=E3Q813_COLGM|nr:uncharacterized protein GLRG_02196 [Colletotrichum graminicola M1.001]EFQ27025.1 hypothetical protein GLRG_02196 [Colletotrichum graminicola M1.001]